MQTDIVIAGFGGQGVMFAGQLLAYTAMDASKEVTWFPSYGPEMRGGTANCTIIIGDEEIGSPMVRNPQVALILNTPSLDKYEPLMQPGGLMIINRSIVGRKVERTDIDVVYLPALEMAEEIGSSRMANMVMIGAMLGKIDVLPMDILIQSLADHLPEKRKNLLPLNKDALSAGYAFVQPERIPA
jgi:2-oxoglutarate ferredoxin oxidoreductase subunit gamma